VFIYEMERALLAEPNDDTLEVAQPSSRDEAVAGLFDRYYGSLRGLAVVILGDVFRRRDISGWAKAAWTVFLVVLPWIGASSTSDVSHRAEDLGR
jgi:hypothetical protein